MFQTKNSLPEKVRIQVIGMLQERLADSVDLFAQMKNAHWNVKGHNFIALHKLFDEIAEESETYGDLIAERIMQLGGAAEGTLAAVVERSGLPEVPALTRAGKDHVAAMATCLSVYGELMRASINKAAEVGDADTADICTQISRGADKSLWFVEAHNQTDAHIKSES